MTKTFTQNDLIRYIYNETSPKESVEIQQALLCNDKLHEEHKQLSSMVNLLDELVESRAPSSVSSSRSKV
jgi:anti-sigma factor RsiW